MGYSRQDLLREEPDDRALTRDMVGIGMYFASHGNLNPPIEETLVYASMVGMDDADLRVLSVLTTWLRAHRMHVHVDRLVRCLSADTSDRVRAYWSAIAFWFGKDRRFARLLNNYDGPPVDLLPVGTEFQLSRHGEDERFKGSSLRVPAGTLRDRDSDVASPEVLVGTHAGYRNRVIMGPTWRADVWTALEQHPGVSVAEIARLSGSSFSTAWQVAQDYYLLKASGG